MLSLFHQEKNDNTRSNYGNPRLIMILNVGHHTRFWYYRMHERIQKVLSGGGSKFDRSNVFFMIFSFVF